ncbi:penicillin-binding protein 2 [bacterium]|jgi:cell division protein FtsI/penicillin-binding protein 2|nr:penicillin-binding protein 2 [bacterium]MBT4764248.1 penicillin-binding protein 2 [bacterium]MBT5401620.1 penicillin-binding protein 2 [bacterium]MBT5942421.1 penicillin-binding protein 2 [bacterium]MBT6067994.1 penicillin-binding protein 2 [bacterium]
MNQYNGQSRSFLISADRLTIISIVFFLLTALTILKLFNLQVINHNKYLALAEEQHLALAKLNPERGTILIHDREAGEDVLYPVALNRKYFLAYAVPNQVKNPLAYSKLLAPILEMEEDTLLYRLSKEDDIYEPLKHKLDDLKKLEIESLELEGIRFQEEVFRFYPEENIGSQVLGFVGYQGDDLVGRYGIEGYWQDELAGSSGTYEFERDAVGRLIPIGGRLKADQVNGANIVLTIDRAIQFFACSALEATVLKHGAEDGSVIIMDPETGAIMAMCNYPDFNPNNYNEVENIEVYNNRAIFEPYEPGSMIKGITMAAAVDIGGVTPATTYIDTGTVEISGFTIHNSDGEAHGLKNMTQVLEESLNTGAIYAARQIGPDIFKNYFYNFGYGDLTDIRLETERNGDIKNLSYPNEIFMATASYGQGITATPLQVINSFAAIANQGKLMKPYIVEEIIHPDGRQEKTDPTMIRQVITNQTAQTLSAMLASVVKYGHAQRAGVHGYYIAGKTGTAQVADSETGKYSIDKSIHSFVGFAPVQDPKFVMLIKLNHPKSVEFASSSAAPLFGEISQFLLNYLQVPPAYN